MNKKYGPCDEDLRHMKPRTVDWGWEDSLVAFKDTIVEEFRLKPMNMICMFIVFGIAMVAILYGASYIAPTFDPSY